MHQTSPALKRVFSLALVIMLFNISEGKTWQEKLFTAN
jgi:hypothetical protein